jgi:hypothetical protein
MPFQQGFPNMPLQQGGLQNPNPQGGQGVNFNPNAGISPNASSQQGFPNMPSPQGIPQNPSPYGAPGVNFNLNVGIPPNIPFQQGIPSNFNPFGRQGVNFNPNAGIPPHFTAVLGKLNETCQTNGRINATFLATLPPPQRAGERTQVIMQTIQTFVADRGLPDSAVIILHVTGGNFLLSQRFSQLELISSLASGSKEILSASRFSDKNISSFLNGNTGTSQLQPGIWQQLWRAGTLHFFVIYNNEIYTIFPTNDPNPSLFATNANTHPLPNLGISGADLVQGAKVMQAAKVGAQVWNQQRSLPARAMDKLKFWKTPTHQKVANWADIASAAASAFQ